MNIFLFLKLGLLILALLIAFWLWLHNKSTQPNKDLKIKQKQSKLSQNSKFEINSTSVLTVNKQQGINLDTFEIFGLKLGGQTELSNGNHIDGSVSVFVEKSILKFISVRLGEFYSKGEIYTGHMTINGQRIEINEELQPETIQPHFNTPIENFDDDVEVNYSYKVKNVEVEFSWHWQSNKLIPNYIAFEFEPQYPQKQHSPN